MYFDKSKSQTKPTKRHIVSAASSKTTAAKNMIIKRMLENKIHTLRFVCFDKRNVKDRTETDRTSIERAEMKLIASGWREKLERGRGEGFFPFPFLSRFVFPFLSFFVPLSLRLSLNWIAHTILALRVHPISRYTILTNGTTFR